ncbi:MAG: hypothetical protein ACI8T1_000298 [Verrucomicrobiales bacterium]|jgi:hypothetical protein
MTSNPTAIPLALVRSVKVPITVVDEELARCLVIAHEDIEIAIIVNVTKVSSPRLLSEIQASLPSDFFVASLPVIAEQHVDASRICRARCRVLTLRQLHVKIAIIVGPDHSVVPRIVAGDRRRRTDHFLS